MARDWILHTNLKNAPMVSGRSRVKEFEGVIAANLGINIRFRQSKDYSKILHITKQMIDNSQPVFAYVDMPFLSYIGLEKDSHFGGHSIIIFGYDDEQKCFYVSDRDNIDYPIRTPKGLIRENYHLVEYTQMEKARRNKKMLTSSIKSVCE